MRSDIHENANVLICLVWRSSIDGKQDDDEERETVVEDDFSDITPSAYKKGAFCLLAAPRRRKPAYSREIPTFPLVPN